MGSAHACSRSLLEATMVFPVVGASPQDAPPPAVVKEILVCKNSESMMHMMLSLFHLFPSHISWTQKTLRQTSDTLLLLVWRFYSTKVSLILLVDDFPLAHHNGSLASNDWGWFWHVLYAYPVNDCVLHGRRWLLQHVNVLPLGLWTHFWFRISLRFAHALQCPSLRFRQIQLGNGACLQSCHVTAPKCLLRQCRGLGWKKFNVNPDQK